MQTANELVQATPAPVGWADSTAQAASGDTFEAWRGESAQWRELAEKLRSGHPDGTQQLYERFSKGFRFYLCRQLGAQEAEDKIHDVFLIIVDALRRGDLRQPECLLGFILTVLRRQIAAHIGKAIEDRQGSYSPQARIGLLDQRANPEEEAIARQKQSLVEEILHLIPERDREVLTRFYLLEQSPDQICREMNLTATQFRLLKSRAKSRFGRLGKRRLFVRPFPVKRRPAGLDWEVKVRARCCP